ncbi:MAG: hypothetical protein K6A44_06800 [bacterium]|nr:hypothetical protein [bacterium]
MFSFLTFMLLMAVGACAEESLSFASSGDGGFIDGGEDDYYDDEFDDDFCDDYEDDFY